MKRKLFYCHQVSHRLTNDHNDTVCLCHYDHLLVTSVRHNVVNDVNNCLGNRALPLTFKKTIILTSGLFIPAKFHDFSVMLTNLKDSHDLTIVF